MKKDNNELENEDGDKEENKIPNVVVAGNLLGDSSGYFGWFILAIILIGTIIGGIYYGLLSLFKKESVEDDTDKIE